MSEYPDDFLDFYLSSEAKALKAAIKELYFAGKWELPDGNEYSPTDQQAMWQQIKDITGWSYTDEKNN